MHYTVGATRGKTAVVCRLGLRRSPLENKPSSHSHPARPWPGSPGGSGLTPTRGPPHLPLVREGRPLLLSGTLSQGAAQPVCQGIGVLEAPHAGSPPQPRWALWRLFPQGPEAPNFPIPPPPPAHFGLARRLQRGGVQASPLAALRGGPGGGETRTGHGWAHARCRHRGRAQERTRPLRRLVARAAGSAISRSLSREPKRRETRKRRLSRRGGLGAIAVARGESGASRPRLPGGTGERDGRAGSGTGSGGAGPGLGLKRRWRGHRPSCFPAAMSRVRPPPGCEGGPEVTPGPAGPWRCARCLRVTVG